MTAPTITAAGPDDAARSGGVTNPGWVAARDRGIQQVADDAAEIHRAAARRQQREAATAARDLINSLLCEWCNRSIPAGDCTCRAWRPTREANP